MRRALVAALLLAACDHTHPRLLPPDSQSGGSWPMQGGASWQSAETLLTPAHVASASFGLLWESQRIGKVETSPLYVDGLRTIYVAGTDTLALVSSEDGAVRQLVTAGTHATPAIELASQRLYLVSGGSLWALDLSTGTEQLPNWPVKLTTQSEPTAPLALSPDGGLVYVAAGPTVTVVDARAARVYATFSTGGGDVVGLAVAPDGRVFGTVGHSGAPQWTDALLEWDATLDLIGTFAPYDVCTIAQAKQDLGAPMVLPDLDATTPHTVAFGAENGTARLVERDRLPGRLNVRSGCGTDPSQDASLLPPSKTPLATVATRNALALFRDANAQTFLFLAGKSATPPSLARIKVAPFPSLPAYLDVDGGAMQVALANPGPPLVSSNGAAEAIVWVLDGNSALYAFDAPTLTQLWQSPPGVLHPAGGGNQPLVVRGKVLVVTDRVQAFGLKL